MKAFTASHFLSREMSWLAFNQRVLDEALSAANPLLERVKFFTITSSNLDEFFEVRVAGLKQQIESDVVDRGIDGRTASQTFYAVAKRVHAMVDQQYACWREQLSPGLTAHGLCIVEVGELDATDRNWAEKYYQTKV